MFSTPVALAFVLFCSEPSPGVCYRPLISKVPPPVSGGVTVNKEAPHHQGTRELRPLFFGGGSSAGLTSYIYNGDEAAPGRYPYIVSLQRPGTEMHFCGGALVAPDIVLTAAHCIDSTVGGDPRPEVRLAGVLGTAACNETCESAVARDSIPHPSWTGQVLDAFDVAFVMLDRELRGVPFASILRQDEQHERWDRANDQLKVAGWGLDSSSDTSPSSFLMEGDVSYLNAPECNRRYRDFLLRDDDIVTHGMMCAGSRGAANACIGDSGGPLILRDPDGNDPSRDVLVAIVSFGVGCSHDSPPAVYSRLTTYESFFNQFLTNTTNPNDISTR